MFRKSERRSPKHIAVWHPEMISELETYGISPRQLIGNTGIRLTDLNVEEPRLDYPVISELFERAAELTENDLFGFHLGQKREMRRLGLVAFIGQSSPTVRSLLHNLARYQRVFSDAIEIDVDQLDSKGAIAWDFDVPRSVAQRQYVEFDAAGLVHWLRALTGRDLVLQAVQFRHYRRSNQAILEKFFGCEVTYGAAANVLTIKQANLELSLRTSDDFLYQMLLRYAEEGLQSQPDSAPDIVVSVEREIASDLRATQPDIARKLGMSTRTLARRLADAGTSFLGVSDAYRQALAKSLMSETDLQITEIAFALGYNNASTFSTTFKRWTGKSPTQFRRLAGVRTH